MKAMIGEIGKWMIGGEQVGGFRNWTVRVRTQPPIKSRVIASGFWMLNKINTDKVLAFFYCEDNGGLNEVCKREAIIHLPEEYPLDKLVIQSVEMTFEEEFDWRDQMNVEAIVYIARKLHWSREEIGKLTPQQFNAILEELAHQESIERYNQNYQVASILAAIYNTIPTKNRKVFKPSDFLEGEATGRQKGSKLEAMAEEKGIKLPKEK